MSFRFGDEQSTLMDRYERLSFEVQLNQAILARSLSEPSTARCQPSQKLVAKPVRQGKRALGFRNGLKKLFGPFFGKQGARKDGTQDSKDPNVHNNSEAYTALDI